MFVGERKETYENMSSKDHQHTLAGMKPYSIIIIINNLKLRENLHLQLLDVVETGILETGQLKTFFVFFPTTFFKDVNFCISFQKC